MSQIVQRPTTKFTVTGNDESGYKLDVGNTFKAPANYTPNQNSDDLAARISALQTAVAELKNFLNAYNTNSVSLIEDIKAIRTANVQIASNKAS